PLILVTNDDGITAPGLRALIEVMNQLGDVIVVAPDSPQSAMGHAITLNSTLYCSPITIDEKDIHLEYSCSGTPVDCVKLAVNEILNRDRKSTRLNSSHVKISYAVFCLKKKIIKYNLLLISWLLILIS